MDADRQWPEPLFSSKNTAAAQLHPQGEFILNRRNSKRTISNQITPPICSSPTLYQGRVSEEEGSPHDTKNGVPRHQKYRRSILPITFLLGLPSNLGPGREIPIGEGEGYTIVRVSIPTFKPPQRLLFTCLVVQRTELGASHILSRLSTSKQHPQPWSL